MKTAENKWLAGFEVLWPGGKRRWAGAHAPPAGKCISRDRFRIVVGVYSIVLGCPDWKSQIPDAVPEARMELLAGLTGGREFAMKIRADRLTKR
jgi:hypothetical protein